MNDTYSLFFTVHNRILEIAEMYDRLYYKAPASEITFRVEGEHVKITQKLGHHDGYDRFSFPWIWVTQENWEDIVTDAVDARKKQDQEKSLKDKKYMLEILKRELGED